MLGKFTLEGIPPMPRGQPQIDVSFDVDANGILNVNAMEKSTGKEQKITITNDKGRLSQADIEQMVADAEKYKDDDDKIKMVIESKNKLENYVYSMESVVNDEKIKLDDEDKNKVAEKIEEIKTWLYTNSDNITEYENKQKELEEIVKPIMEKMGAGAGAGAGRGMPEDNEMQSADIPVNEAVNEPSIEEID
jgi:L1 cell adhesion molecule like protein